MLPTHTYLAGEIPWSRRWFTQGEAQPLHFGCADPCEFPKCGNLDCIICGSGGLRPRSPLIIMFKCNKSLTLGLLYRFCCSAYLYSHRNAFTDATDCGRSRILQQTDGFTPVPSFLFWQVMFARNSCTACMRIFLNLEQFVLSLTQRRYVIRLLLWFLSDGQNLPGCFSLRFTVFCKGNKRGGDNKIDKVIICHVQPSRFTEVFASLQQVLYHKRLMWYWRPLDSVNMHGRHREPNNCV